MMKKYLMIGLLCVPFSCTFVRADRSDAQLLVGIEDINVQDVLTLLEKKGSTGKKNHEQLIHTLEKSIKNHEAQVALLTPGKDLFTLVSGGVMSALGVYGLYVGLPYVLNQSASIYKNLKRSEVHEDHGNTNYTETITKAFPTFGGALCLSVGLYLAHKAWKCTSALTDIRKKAAAIHASIDNAFGKNVESAESTQEIKINKHSLL
ncbi:hypothetical protein H0W26_01735 [Candidatus Dependentiae bacterium]|nr:hypothetical protein [Candidatus Dependentiae bacterium]